MLKNFHFEVAALTFKKHLKINQETDHETKVYAYLEKIDLELKKPIVEKMVRLGELF